MNFESTYDKAVSLVRKRMWITKRNGDPSEYVNQSYLHLIEQGKEMTVKSLVSHAIRFMATDRDFVNFKKPEFTRETTKVCAKCRNDLPIAIFGLVKEPAINKRRLQPYCRDCAKVYFKEYWNRWRGDWNKKLRERYRKDADNLTDNYIKKILRVYGWKTENITPEVIRFKRREMVAKRQ